MSDTNTKTTWMRRYTTDPERIEEFIDFLTSRVIPVRESRGFIIEQGWVNPEGTQLTWFVSYEGSPEDFAAAEKAWEESEDRAQVFADAPAYVTAKDLQQARQIF
ncbi:hypothetical protein [Citricoccus sp. NR2]|uniref:hypothetical protein n=1 Tax=Citricoccus sp. NR2 TaxID=3004095 RepID=UPI0022DE96BB|nr:hypothetical protein [Citricoccus sp. NR2]WBL19026.1 hypothetical protein O1A05_14985 [Citricoccus sp. NR2]